MSDYAFMPFSDYEDACDATREKTGKTDPITSGELAAEIRSIQTGGGGGAVASANILNGVVLNPGYLNVNGFPQAQSGTNLEVYTDEIDVSDFIGQTLNLYVSTATVGVQWLGCCFFDASHAIVGQRQNIQPSPSMKGAVFNVVVPSGAKYIRFSWRTFGNARYAASVGDSVYNALGDVGFGIYPEVS